MAPFFSKLSFLGEHEKSLAICQSVNSLHAELASTSGPSVSNFLALEGHCC